MLEAIMLQANLKHFIRNVPFSPFPSERSEGRAVTCSREQENLLKRFVLKLVLIGFSNSVSRTPHPAPQAITQHLDGNEFPLSVCI